MNETIICIIYAVFISGLASSIEFKYSGDAVSIVYPKASILTRRSSNTDHEDKIAVAHENPVNRLRDPSRPIKGRDHEDSIAMDNARVSRIAPMRGKLYEMKSRATQSSPATAVSSSEIMKEDKIERKDDENVDNEERMEKDVVSNNVESDPQNTYLQVGKWIAQWDAPYEAWYYYNSETGVSTWNKPKELETIEFTDPIPDIEAAKKKVQAAHKLKEQEIESEAAKGGGQSVRLERDKPGHSDDQHHTHTTSTQNHHSPVSFTSSSPHTQHNSPLTQHNSPLTQHNSPLTQHNSMSIGPRPTLHPISRPASQVSDPIFDQNFNRPTSRPNTSPPQTLSQQIKLNQQKSQANSNYAGPPLQVDSATDAYGAPQADPVSNYSPGDKAPTPYGKPVFEYTLDCLRRKGFSLTSRTSCFDWSETFNSVFNGGVTRTGALIGVGAFVLFNIIFYTAVVATGSQSNPTKTITKFIPQLSNVFFEKRGFEGLFEDNPEADQILELIQSFERSSETMVDEL